MDSVSLFQCWIPNNALSIVRSPNRPGLYVQLAEYEIRYLCEKAREIFLKQPTLLELEAPINIIGNIWPHFCYPAENVFTLFSGSIRGHYDSLLRLFERGGFPPEADYLFLGSYVDRGKQSLETICLLLAYKIKYPDNFFMLRGIHECDKINRIYGFYDECVCVLLSSSVFATIWIFTSNDLGKRRYSITLWKTFNDCFNCLPIAAIIGEKIFAVHGGLSPDLQSMEQIRRISRPTDVPDVGEKWPFL